MFTIVITSYPMEINEYEQPTLTGRICIASSLICYAEQKVHTNLTSCGITSHITDPLALTSICMDQKNTRTIIDLIRSTRWNHIYPLPVRCLWNKCNGDTLSLTIKNYPIELICISAPDPYQNSSFEKTLKTNMSVFYATPSYLPDNTEAKDALIAAGLLVPRPSEHTGYIHGKNGFKPYKSLEENIKQLLANDWMRQENKDIILLLCLARCLQDFS